MAIILCETRLTPITSVMVLPFRARVGVAAGIYCLLMTWPRREDSTLVE